MTVDTWLGLEIVREKRSATGRDQLNLRQPVFYTVGGSIKFIHSNTRKTLLLVNQLEINNFKSRPDGTN